MASSSKIPFQRCFHLDGSDRFGNKQKVIIINKSAVMRTSISRMADQAATIILLIQATQELKLTKSS